jgi:hypothetical protein
MARNNLRLMPAAGSTPPGIADRVAALAWDRILERLDERGFATFGPLLTPEECAGLAGSYAEEALFRSRIDMARYRFGQGEYQYFAAPLPDLVAGLRSALYPPLAPLANRWHEAMRLPARFPGALDELTAACHAAGQTRPTPLLLRYRAGDYNCLHQDVYGDLVFPLQVAFLLSRPAEDFAGGEFVLVEQRPRAQSRAEVVPLRQGEGVIFAVRHRPVRGSQGWYRAAMRHGVSTLRSGERFTLGVIFHDAA